MTSQSIELRVSCARTGNCPVFRTGRCDQLKPVNLGFLDLTQLYDVHKLNNALFEYVSQRHHSCQSVEAGAKRETPLVGAVPKFALDALIVHQVLAFDTPSSFSVPINYFNAY